MLLSQTVASSNCPLSLGHWAAALVRFLRITVTSTQLPPPNCSKNRRWNPKNQNSLKANILIDEHLGEFLRKRGRLCSYASRLIMLNDRYIFNQLNT